MGPVLTALVGLAEPSGRRDAARVLARVLGADDLVLFLPDADVDANLPAPGFPQTLPDGRKWRAFVGRCTRDALVEGVLRHPRTGEDTEAVGLCSVDGCVLVLLGPAPRVDDARTLLPFLPLLSAAFRAERLARAGEAQAGLAHAAAAQAGALAEALASAQGDLQGALRELRAASQRKDEFLAMLAHELRNPLAAISSALGVIDAAGAERHRVLGATAIAGRQVHHLAHLVDDLLDVSRIDVGKIELRPVQLDLRAVVTRATESMGAHGSSHRLTIDLPPEAVTVSGDRVRLEQVVSNLLTNAFKYTDRGGAVTVVLRAEGKDAVIRVEDTGIGVSAELLPHLFDLFVQADQSLARAQGGLGIGLTLVRSLVTLHSGSVTAHSAGEGQGSAFVVRLPLLTAPTGKPVTKPALVATPPPGTEALRVLVVDDNEDSAEMMAEALRIAGHDVRTAHLGADGVALAATFEPAVALLDIGLPDMSGFDVAHHLRAARGGRPLLLVAITGYGQAADREKGRLAGFDEYLVKPVALDRIRALLARALPDATSATPVC